ncbi:hypothetical protein DCC81_11930 [Chitinophaga parva]|uniref:Uncharacterized protein n=1 Tax=Chitinophaga parva TaxID=2169414 RepID=A0A2T7BFF1_9BACT|nr:hypothetical protein [Chitinophaga parva]PUZ25016.1 hypothetical protein DCC81_11930 [Chitinophaga parva]
MITTDFIALKDFILNRAGVFCSGFANVILDESTGLIVRGDGFEKQAIGIDDRYGNYFYIRNEPEIRYTDARSQISDTRRSVDETVKCYLVAIVENAMPKELIQILLDSLLQYGDKRIRPIKSISTREAAVAKEFAKIPKEDLQNALQHLYNRQVVIIEFDFVTTWNAGECLPSITPNTNC